MFNYSQALLLVMASTYVASGIVIRIGGILRRRLRQAPRRRIRSIKLDKPALALVGSESLLGREVRDLAATSADLDLTLIAADEEHEAR